MAGDTKRKDDLFELVRNGDTQQVIVRINLEPKLVERRDENERTPLHWAASSGRKEIAQFLLDRGSPADAADDAGWTPLIIASSAGHEAVVRLLLGAGAAIDFRTDQGTR